MWNESVLSCFLKQTWNRRLVGELSRYQQALYNTDIKFYLNFIFMIVRNIRRKQGLSLFEAKI